MPLERRATERDRRIMQPAVCGQSPTTIGDKTKEKKNSDLTRRMPKTFWFRNSATKTPGTGPRRNRTSQVMLLTSKARRTGSTWSWRHLSKPTRFPGPMPRHSKKDSAMVWMIRWSANSANIAKAGSAMTGLFRGKNVELFRGLWVDSVWVWAIATPQIKSGPALRAPAPIALDQSGP